MLERIHPEVAVIEVGAGNRYGHPNPDTLAALPGTIRDTGGGMTTSVGRLRPEPALERGWYVSFAGNVTYPKNEHLRRAVAPRAGRVGRAEVEPEIEVFLAGLEHHQFVIAAERRQPAAAGNLSSLPW